MIKRGRLAVTRRSNEELIFEFQQPDGQVVTLRQTFKEISGNQARVCIDAPVNVKIIRAELNQ